jgi:predicted MFS family arabinose efflux permease
MASGSESRHWLVALLSSSTFATMTVAVMMGPVLIPLAAEFHTSVAGAGQLAAVIGVSWGIVAPLIGPISDTYGRRKVALTGMCLMAIGVIAALLASNYWILLICRLVMGAGAAMIPPNAMATIADRFAASERGRPISLLISSTCLGYIVALPAIAALGEIGGWRLPFAAIASFLALELVWHWLGFPRSAPPSQSPRFMAHFAHRPLRVILARASGERAVSRSLVCRLHLPRRVLRSIFLLHRRCRCRRGDRARDRRKITHCETSASLTDRFQGASIS